MWPTTCLSSLTNKIWIVRSSLIALKEQRIVGKPQKLSRLRYVNIVIPSDETDEERAYRIEYESLQDWNNKYWAENNELFNKAKVDYIKKNFDHVGSDEDALSHDQLAPFYKNFLEQNRKRHVIYNRIWYKNHLALLSSSITAKISRFKVNLSAYESKGDA